MIDLIKYNSDSDNHYEWMTSMEDVIISIFINLLLQILIYHQDNQWLEQKKFNI